MVEKKNLIKKRIDKTISKIKDIGGNNIRFIILYGSLIKNNFTDLSDIDIAVYYRRDEEQRFEFRKKILGRVGDKFDIQTFQDLPIYIQEEIISTGNIIEYKNYQETFKIFMKTIRDYEHLKPILDLYFSELGV